MGILRQCQEKGSEYLSRKKDDFAALQRDLEAARTARDAEKLRRLDTRMAELRKPLEAIFENELKPRLEPIPTREQRRAAEASAATQPATSQPRQR